MSDTDLTSPRLRELLAYDKETGVFTRIVPTRNVKAGTVVVATKSRGYDRISVLGRKYRAHRLAWLHVHGEWPAGQIDHIDGRRDNNAIANLRDVSSSVNNQNQRRAQRHNTHGTLGVTRHGKQWRAQISINSKTRYLGLFATSDLAQAAYLETKRLLHPGCTI